MKKTIIVASSIILLLAIALSLYLLNGCQKNVEPIELATPYIISGKVVDYRSCLPISDVTIVCLDKKTTTNSEGIYNLYFNELPKGFTKISAKKDGYPVGTTIITEAYYSSVNTIALVPPAISKTIDINGGSISVHNSESIDASQKIEVLFPKGALNENTTVSLTQLEGIYVPDISPRKTLGLLNVATVCLEPSGLKLNKNTTITFPLPMKIYKGALLDLLIYNEHSLSWEISSIKAIVDTSGTQAIAEINHFSTYSIGIKGNYTEEISDANWLDESEKTSISQGEYCYKATVYYPNGIPDNISPNWLKNIVSQNTELSGRVSFFEETYLNINLQNKSTLSRQQNKSVVIDGCFCNAAPSICFKCDIHDIQMFCEMTIHEYISINTWINQGYTILLTVENYLTVRKSFVCRVYENCVFDVKICPPHKGGSGK